MCEDKKVTRSSQHGYTKGKSHLNNLMEFYAESTTWVDEEMCFLFRKPFNTVSHDNTLTDKLMKSGLKWTVR